MQVGTKEFRRTKFSALTGQTVCAYVADDETFKLVADKGGVEMTGTLRIETEEEIQAFAKLLSAVWEDRRKLKPKITTSLSGH